MNGSDLLATSAWGLGLLACFVGWGDVVTRIAKPGFPVGLGLRAAWGAAALVAICGPLALVSLASRPVLTALVVLGVLSSARAAFQHRKELLSTARLHVRFAARRPGSVTLVAIVLALLLLRYLGAASDLTSNPYDDDTAYYPLAKQLFDRGSLIDPFSFRRMSSLGGTAVFDALTLVGTRIDHIPFFDSGLCTTIVVAQLLTQRLPRTPIPFFGRILACLVVLTLPSVAINVASYQSGLALFLALLLGFDGATASPSDGWRSVLRTMVPTAIVASATCTLRQNYQATIALLLVVALGFALLGRSGARARAIVIAAGGIFVLVLPWLLLSYRSNDTFLFPLMKGTYQSKVALADPLLRWPKTLEFFVDTLLRAEPFEAAGIFAVVAFALPDRTRRHLRVAEWIATLASILLMCRAFSQSDVSNITRYNYAFLVAAMLMTWLAASASISPNTPSLMRIGALVCAFAATFLIHIGATKTMLSAQLRDVDEQSRRVLPPASEPPNAAAYHRLQEAVPAGQRLLVMVDEPFRFDFRRNEIWNLDTPGLSGPPPGVPCFEGPEPLAAYLRQQGIRYVAIVDYEKSVYLYRRDIWMENLFGPNELLRQTAPYVVSVLDDLHSLAQSRTRLFDDSGLLLLDLDRKP